MNSNEEMTSQERRAAYSLAAIFLLRMLGLFMILPVFSLYAESLDGATPALIGFAIGAYGLAQAFLQMPLGMISDRIGRKPVIHAGLVIFAVGSVIAAMADTMSGVIIGRVIQGAGAIAATVMALAADLTREEHRLKAMAIIGISIGLSFSLSLVAGPLLNSWIGVEGIFWLTAIFAIGGMVMVHFVVPNPEQSRFHRDTEAVPTQIRAVLADGQLLRLDFGIFALHMILTATFVVFPFVLRDEVGLDTSQHWIIYLVVMLLSLATMVPFIIQAEKRRRMKQVFVAAIALVCGAQLLFALSYTSLAVTVIALFVFFTAFNILEATLPSLIAKAAPPDKKGTAMGVYSSSQFLGAFCGGVAGGWLYGTTGLSGVFVFSALVAMIWVVLGMTMKNPRYLSSYMLRVGDKLSQDESRRLAARLTGVRGVAEAVVIAEDGVAYLKVDHHALDRDSLKQFAAAQV